MKRIVSLMLCLTVILGLLTGMAAGNGTEGTQAQGLVANKNLEGQTWLSGGMGFDLTLNGNRVVPSEDVEVRLSNDRIGELFYNENDKEYPWGISFQTGYPGESGYIYVKSGDQTYSVAVSTDENPAFGLYTSSNCDKASYIPFRGAAALPFTPGQATTVYVRAATNLNGSVNAISTYGGGTASVGTSQTSGAWKIWPVTVTSDARFACVEIQASGNDFGTSWDLRFKDKETIRLDMTKTPAGQSAQFGEDWALPVEDDEGKTYYLNLGAPNGPYVGGASGGYPFVNVRTLPVAAYYYQLVDVGDGSTQQVPLTDGNGNNDLQLAQALTQKIKAQYGDLSIRLYPATPSSSAQGPVIEPVEPDSVEEARYAARAVYTFDTETDGNYILTLEAVKNGQMQILSCAWLEMVGTPGEFAMVDSIEAAEAVLEKYGGLEEAASITLQFSVQELEGQLNIPAIPGIVSIRGFGYEEGPGTELKGGIEITGGTTVGITNFHFKGDSEKKENEYLDQDETIPNSALYGTTGASLWKCSIEDYYYGVRVDESNTMMNFGGGDVTFKNNHIGIYVNYSSQYAGVRELIGYRFINNGTAIKIDNLDIGVLGNKSMNALTVQNGIFINNGVDVENNDEEVLWMPMCYFLHAQKDLHTHPDKYEDETAPNKHAACWQPVTLPKPQNKHQVPAVIASPAAQAPSCAVADGYFYPKHVYVSDSIRNIYPIDTLESGLAVTAVDNENTAIATVELTQETQSASVEPTVARAGIYSLRRLAAPVLLADEEGSTPVPAFDSVMQKAESASQITLEIGAIPDDYAGTVTVPCKCDAAYVYHNGKLIASTMANGQVSFDAVKSENRETYVIKKVAVQDAPVPDSDKNNETPKADFSDVTEDAWYAEAVQYVYENGLMNGMGGGKFQPEAQTSRAMVITMLARLAGADVDDSDPWYAKALKWAVANGVSDGTMPNGSITRQQIVTMLWRYAGSPKPQGKLEGFVDADKIAPYALDAMTWAVERKIIQGVGGDRLDPTGTATRAQIATMFWNYLKR